MTVCRSCPWRILHFALFWGGCANQLYLNYALQPAAVAVPCIPWMGFSFFTRETIFVGNISFCQKFWIASRKDVWQYQFNLTFFDIIHTGWPFYFFQIITLQNAFPTLSLIDQRYLWKNCSFLVKTFHQTNFPIQKFFPRWNLFNLRIFVQIAKCICLNSNMYLSKL